MPQPVGADTAALSRLTDRIAHAATELSAVAVPGVEGLPGSALAGVDGPRAAAADVRRLGAVVHAWVVAARRAADGLTAADEAGANRLGPR